MKKSSLMKKLLFSVGVSVVLSIFPVDLATSTSPESSNAVFEIPNNGNYSFNHEIKREDGFVNKYTLIYQNYDLVQKNSYIPLSDGRVRELKEVYTNNQATSDTSDVNNDRTINSYTYHPNGEKASITTNKYLANKRYYHSTLTLDSLGFEETFLEKEFGRDGKLFYHAFGNNKDNTHMLDTNNDGVLDYRWN